MKHEVFNTELNKINSDEVRESTEILLDMLPDYFYTVPASTSGKYHPQYALGEGGLVRHTKVAERILEELFRNKTFAPHGEYTKDLMRMAILLHDGFKCGYTNSGHTVTEHPTLMADFIFENANELKISLSDAIFVSDLISTHMGPWITDKTGKEILEEPKTREQIVVHLCDYIASREFLNVEFDGNEIVEGPKRTLNMK